MARRPTPLTDAPPAMGAREVRALRKRLRVSQASLATILNVSVELVQAWEGERRVPRGAALRLLDLVRARPELVAAPAGAGSDAGTDARAGAATGAEAAVAPRAIPVRPTVARRGPGRRASDLPRTAPGAPRVAAVAAAGGRTVRETAAAAPAALLRGLLSHGVAFVTVGGVAAQLHGASGRTDDLDIVYDRTPANLDRLASFLRGIRTTLRGAPGTIPFAADPRTLAHTAVLALDTALGPLDLRQRIAGIGDFAASLSNATTVAFDGRQVPTLTLDALIVSKRATGRSKDREEVRALEALR